MVLPSDVYPGFGFPVQGYSVQQPGHNYPMAEYYSSTASTQVATNPYLVTPQPPNYHVMNAGGYAQQQDDWSGRDKQPDGPHNKIVDYSSAYNFNDSYAYSSDKLSKAMPKVGLGTYPVPMGMNGMQPPKIYEYKTSSHDLERCPTYYHNPSGLPNGYQNVTWTSKRIDD